jgi:hypothetical protein
MATRRSSSTTTNDIGNFWEWLDQPRLPLQGTMAGVRLGINYLLFSMSH